MTNNNQRQTNSTPPATGPGRAGPKGINWLISEAVDRIDELYNNDRIITGISTGFKALDEKIKGLQAGELVVVAGRPGIGKTAFSRCLIENTSMHSDKLVVIYTLEMTARYLITDMFSSIGSIDHTKVHLSKMEDSDWPKLANAVNLLRDRALFIDDSTSLSLKQVHERTTQLTKEHGEPGLIWIDNLQLMRLDDNETPCQPKEILEIFRGLKALAKNFNCPVIVNSLIKNKLENRKNKRPMLCDLRNSKAIEHFADVILLIYRDEFYHLGSEDKGVAEITIGKQHRGAKGTVRLAFKEEYVRFENLTG